MMENWLHSGIDKNLLEKEFNDFKNLDFPDEPEEDELYELYSELVELDGHIAGLVSSYIKNGSIDLKLLDADGKFNNILRNFQVESDIIAIMVEYKKRLDKLIQMVKSIEQ